MSSNQETENNIDTNSIDFKSLRNKFKNLEFSEKNHERHLTEPSNLNRTNKTFYNHRKTVSINNNDFISNNSINTIAFSNKDSYKRISEAYINDYTNLNTENNSEHDLINVNEEIDLDINDSIIQAVNNIKRNIGKLNIIISGKTGVGKSSLINSIFHENLAKTGTGRPVTQDIKEITKEGVPIAIFDTKGLEIENYKNILKDLEEFIKEKRNRSNVNEQLHVAWLCIAESNMRVEPAEEELLQMLINYNIPVIVVMTKAMREDIEVINDFNEYKSYLERLKENNLNENDKKEIEKEIEKKIEDMKKKDIKEKDIKEKDILIYNYKSSLERLKENNLNENDKEEIKNYIAKNTSDDTVFLYEVKNICSKANGHIRVRAKPMKISEKIEINTMNLEKLVEVTYKILPNGIKNAFIASQKVLLKLKNDVSTNIIQEYKNKTTVGNLLIPFKDLKYLIKLEIEMIIAISAAFGLQLEKEFTKKIIKIIFIDENKLGSKVKVSNVLKFIPGINVVGAKISKSKLSKTIEEIGNIYINALYNEFKRKNGELPSNEDITKALLKEKGIF